VADIVRRQSDPSRPAERADEPPMSSRIIRAANAFDDLVGSSVEPSRAAAAVQRLRLDTACEYDPQVIEALSRLISRRSVLGP
jgi:HD-GYP domain-containing protein (c-di-GMP phosphodiesterase class II)